MSSDSIQLDDLRTGFIIGVSVLGSVCFLLLVAVILLVIWNCTLHKKIKKLEPFVNFKLLRPKVTHEQRPPLPQPRNQQVHDNPGYSYTPENETTKRDLNPIALRSKASIDNGNFSFGNSNNQSNSFNSPDYLDLDSKFY